MSVADIDGLNFVGYNNKRTLLGNSGGQARFTCAVADWLAARDLLMRAVNGDDPSLAVESVSFDYLGKDAAAGIAELTATFIPAWKLNCLIPNSAFKIRGEVSSLSFTVAPKDRNGNVKWKWASGQDILNDSIMPLHTQGVLKLVLFGTRTEVDAGTWLSYVDHTNSDTFLGAPPGCALFKGAPFNPRVLEDGTPTNDVELHVETRFIPWNKFYNETTSAWEEIHRTSDSSPMFSPVTFGDLLTVPS